MKKKKKKTAKNMLVSRYYEIHTSSSVFIKCFLRIYQGNKQINK